MAFGRDWLVVGNSKNGGPGRWTALTRPLPTRGGSYQKRIAGTGVGEGVGEEESRTSARVRPSEAAVATKITAIEANHIPDAYFM